MKAIERFYVYLTENRLKPSSIEKEIGLSNGYLSAQKKRLADMGESVINKIIDYCRDINPEWLLTGKGTMLRENKQSSQVPNPNDSFVYQLYKEMEAKADRLLEENISLKNKIRRLEESDELPRRSVPNASTASNMKRGSGAPSIITAKSEILEIKNKGL